MPAQKPATQEAFKRTDDEVVGRSKQPEDARAHHPAPLDDTARVSKPAMRGAAPVVDVADDEVTPMSRQESLAAILDCSSRGAPATPPPGDDINERGLLGK